MATLSILVARVVLLEHSEVHEKAYNFTACEFGSFHNVLRNLCHPYIEITTYIIYQLSDWRAGASLHSLAIQPIFFLHIYIDGSVMHTVMLCISSNFFVGKSKPE